MNVRRHTTALSFAVIMVVAILLLGTGATLAQRGVPATEGGDRFAEVNSTGQPDGTVQQPDGPVAGPAGTDTGETVEFTSPQGYVDGAAPDDNATRTSGAVNATFSYYTASGPELQPRTTTNNQVYSANGCVYMASGSGTGLLTGVGLHLPDNAVIKYIRLYYNDTDAAVGVDAYLTRYAPGSATSDLVNTGSTNEFNGGYGFVVSSEITETVNNASHAYMIYGWPDSASYSLQVCGLRVAYYAPYLGAVFMPVIVR